MLKRLDTVPDADFSPIRSPYEPNPQDWSKTNSNSMPGMFITVQDREIEELLEVSPFKMRPVDLVNFVINKVEVMCLLGPRSLPHLYDFEVFHPLEKAEVVELVLVVRDQTIKLKRKLKKEELPFPEDPVGLFTRPGVFYVKYSCLCHSDVVWKEFSVRLG